MASTITDSPEASSTMEAAARAASVAPETAIPQSAFFSAGASLTPSPVMPTMWPRCCRTSTMWNLCSGKTCAKPSAFSMVSAICALSWCLVSPSALASRIFVPIPSCFEVSRAMAIWSPVTILTSTPMCRALAMVALACSRGGSNNGSTPANCHLPSSSARATPSERKPRPANSFTAFSTAGLTAPAFVDICRMTCGAPLATKNCFPSRAFDGGFGTLMHGVEWLEV